VRILYITTSYSPQQGVNFTRVHDLLSYFIKEELAVTVVTPQKINIFKNLSQVIVPYSSHKKDGLFLRYIKNFYSIKSDPQPEQWVNDVEEYFKKHSEVVNHSTVVLINIGPLCLINLASYFKNKFGLKTAIDMHDSLAFTPERQNLFFLERFFQNYEKKIFHDVDLLFTMTPSMKKIYQKFLPSLRIYYIPHVLFKKTGYYSKFKNDLKKKSTYKIIYGGSLHGSRTIIPLLKAVKKIRNNNKFEVEIIGNFSFLTKLRYFKYPQIVWKKSIPREKYYDYLSQYGDIGLVSQCFAVRHPHTGAIAAKTHEYLALNKAIIYLGHKGDNSEIIEKYSQNHFLFTDPTEKVEKLTTFLKNFQHRTQNTKEIFYSDFQAEKRYAIVKKTLQFISKKYAKN